MYRRCLYPSTVNIEFENILEDLMSIFLYLCFVVAFIVFFFPPPFSGGGRERLEKLLRDWVERTWAFPAAQIPSNPEVSETAWRQRCLMNEEEER